MDRGFDELKLKAVSKSPHPTHVFENEDSELKFKFTVIIISKQYEIQLDKENTLTNYTFLLMSAFLAKISKIS